MNEKTLFITHIFNIKLWCKTNSVLFLLTLSLVSLLMETKYWDITTIELMIFLLYYPNVFESSFTLILQIRKLTFILYFLTTHLTEQSRTSITLGRAFSILSTCLSNSWLQPTALIHCCMIRFVAWLFITLSWFTYIYVILFSFNSFKIIPHCFSQYER